ncbi:AAA family ATPase [Yinghuangia sp. YIM S10712]|uniref:AAA family ATPase n=1 Tax=Yinghuangia sp. YIM S10712 TaxID=3436930 RepID=UPI003F5294DB
MIEGTSSSCRGYPIPSARTDETAAGKESALRPEGLLDFRSAHIPTALRYGPRDILVVSGLPGAGKSTLMSRCAVAPLIDSQHVRDWYRTRLPRSVPYSVYRPLVRATHYRRLGVALRSGGAVVIHDCGTVPLVRRWIARTAKRQGRDVHLLFLDVDPSVAWGGQKARGRRVSPAQFARHRSASGHSLDCLLATGVPPRGWQSAVLLNRPAADRLHSITFENSA